MPDQTYPARLREKAREDRARAKFLGRDFLWHEESELCLDPDEADTIANALEAAAEHDHVDGRCVKFEPSCQLCVALAVLDRLVTHA